MTETPISEAWTPRLPRRFNDALVEDDAPPRGRSSPRRHCPAHPSRLSATGCFALSLNASGKSGRRPARHPHRAPRQQSCSQAFSQIASWIPEPPPRTRADAHYRRRAHRSLHAPAHPRVHDPARVRNGGVNLGPTTPIPTIELAITKYAASLCVISVSVKQECTCKGRLELAPEESIRRGLPAHGRRSLRLIARRSRRARDTSRRLHDSSSRPSPPGFVQGARLLTWREPEA